MLISGAAHRVGQLMEVLDELEQKTEDSELLLMSSEAAVNTSHSDKPIDYIELKDAVVRPPVGVPSKAVSESACHLSLFLC